MAVGYWSTLLMRRDVGVKRALLDANKLLIADRHDGAAFDELVDGWRLKPELRRRLRHGEQGILGFRAKPRRERDQARSYGRADRWQLLGVEFRDCGYEVTGQQRSNLIRRSDIALSSALGSGSCCPCEYRNFRHGLAAIVVEI